MRLLKIAAFVALLLVRAGALPAQTALPLLLKGTVTLPGVHGQLGHLAADVQGARLFVAASANNSVETVEMRTNQRGPSLGGLAEPQAVAYLASSDRLFVLAGVTGTLTIFDGATLKSLSTIPVGANADNIEVDQALGHVFAGDAELDDHGKKIGTVEAKKPMPLACETTTRFPTAMDKDRKLSFVACQQPAKLFTMINLGSQTLVTSLPTVGDAGDISYDPNHDRLYVAGGAGTIFVYQLEGDASPTEIGRIPTAGGARTSLFVPEWDRLFVAVPAHDDAPAEIRIYAPAEPFK